VASHPAPRRSGGRADLLVSNDSRERATSALRGHFTDGRLTADELEQRVQLVLAARTREDLTAAFAGLPRRRSRRDLRGAAIRFQRRALTANAGSYAAVNGGLVGIWALTGGGEFWPAFSMVPWGMLIGAQATALWTTARARTRRRI
jgi:hypothetical protein